MQAIRALIGDIFIVDYNSIVEHKFIYKSKISTQCSKCMGWNMMSIDALSKRIASNNIPYICRKCIVSQSMKDPIVRKKCKRISRSLWNNHIIRQSMVNKANDTKLGNVRFKSKLNDAFN